MLSIIVVFSIGHLFAGVNLPMVDWLLIALILLVGSVVFIAMGVLVSLLPSAQLMSVVEISSIWHWLFWAVYGSL